VEERLTLELGDLKETVSRRRNGRQGRGLTKNFKNVGARVRPSLLPTLLLSSSSSLPWRDGGTGDGGSALSPVMVVGGGRH